MSLQHGQWIQNLFFHSTVCDIPQPWQRGTIEESEAALVMLLLSVKKSEPKSCAVAPLNCMSNELWQIFFSSLLLAKWRQALVLIKVNDTVYGIPHKHSFLPLLACNSYSAVLCARLVLVSIPSMLVMKGKYSSDSTEWSKCSGRDGPLSPAKSLF